MKLSINWLGTYVDHALKPDALADRLTMSGLEVDDLDHIGSSLEGVVVGLVLEVLPHPNADRLTVCRVDIGTDSPATIVCGAPNVAAGQTVPVATVGTTLQLPTRENPAIKQPVTLRRAKIRGQASEGMICAEDELGLSDDHSGIMVLPEAVTPGTPFAAYLASNGVEAIDAVLDIAITPNRPDAVSHIGVARDVAALTGAPLQKPHVDIPAAGGETAKTFAVDIDAPDGCHRYVGMLVRGVKIAPSPAWLQSRLKAIGLRPRNNVVDITNFVMHEVGQPLHAFDFDQLAGARIVVRKTASETPFTTLDGKERKLPKGTLMIRDGDRDVAIAGVMGGENSEVSDATTNVLIESAYFEPSGIRKTAKALQLQTDASYRFERGIDPTGQAWAAARTAQMIVELAGGTLVPGMVDTHPVIHATRNVRLRHARIAAILGMEIPRPDCERLLQAIGFALSPDGTDRSGAWMCSVPAFRPDVEREIDIIEEVARLYGFEHIPVPDHTLTPNARPAAPAEQQPRTHAADILSGLGFREIYTNSMLRQETAEAFDPTGSVVKTLNPISQEMAALRPSLLPGMLQVIGHNVNHGQTALRFFEFGTVFARTKRKDVPVRGYHEHTSLLIAQAGLAVESGWSADPRAVDLFDVKGVVEMLLPRMGILQATLIPGESDLTGEHLDIVVDGQTIGRVARLTASAAGDVAIPVYFAEIDWTHLVSVAGQRGITRYESVSRHPVVARDLAVVVGKNQSAGDLLKTIAGAAGPLLQDVQLFDIYQGDRIGQDQKSLAFALRFGADRTLLDHEVDAAVKSVISTLEKQHGATLRA